MGEATTLAIRFLQTLAVPEGPKAGELIKPALFQKKFIKGAPLKSPLHPEPTKTSKTTGKTAQKRFGWQ
jgi:hypothetical protein